MRCGNVHVTLSSILVMWTLCLRGLIVGRITQIVEFIGTRIQATGKEM